MRHSTLDASPCHLHLLHQQASQLCKREFKKQILNPNKIIVVSLQPVESTSLVSKATATRLIREKEKFQWKEQTAQSFSVSPVYSYVSLLKHAAWTLAHHSGSISLHEASGQLLSQSIPTSQFTGLLKKRRNKNSTVIRKDRDNASMCQEQKSRASGLI